MSTPCLIMTIVWLATGREADTPRSPMNASTPSSQAIASPPGRIITIAPNSAEIICGLGACDSLVAVSKFCVYPPELAGRLRVGGLFDADVERIVALRPDLVVLRGNIASVERVCDKLGIPIYRDETDSLDGVETCIRDLGRLLGREDQAAMMIASFRERLAAVSARVADRPRRRVLLTVSRQPDRLADILTTGRGTFLDEMIRLAGGTNVFGQLDMRYPQVSPEAVVAHRPDTIIELMPEQTVDDSLRQRVLEQWGALGAIPAVASGRVFVLSDANCLIPSPRFVEIVEKVSRLLHPESPGAP